MNHRDTETQRKLLEEKGGRCLNDVLPRDASSARRTGFLARPDGLGSPSYSTSCRAGRIRSVFSIGFALLSSPLCASVPLWFILLGAGSFFALTATSVCAAESGPRVYVIFWFDTEDYLLPASDDAARNLADLLTRE